MTEVPDSATVRRSAVRAGPGRARLRAVVATAAGGGDARQRRRRRLWSVRVSERRLLAARLSAGSEDACESVRGPV